MRSRMTSYRDPTPEDLEQSRDTRVSRQQLDRLEIAANYLEQAARLREEAHQAPDPELALLIARTREECNILAERSEGRVESRRRPRNRVPTDRCTVFLDECGPHAIETADPFPVFVLAAAVIRERDLAAVEARWKEWKRENLGADAIVHEPDIRRGRGGFRGAAGVAAALKLPDVIAELNFVGMAIVVHREDYKSDFGTGPIDASLPDHVYMMALDFLMERVVLALDSHFNARAILVAESRGSKEDALLQHEFSRLHLEGTSYISPAWFRQQLAAGVRFLSKDDNNTGLQLADLLARPIAEKVMDPASTPPRWTVFRDKLCPGHETKNSILGLKVTPWRDRYKDLWKS